MVTMMSTDEEDMLPETSNGKTSAIDMILAYFVKPYTPHLVPVSNPPVSKSSDRPIGCLIVVSC